MPDLSELHNCEKCQGKLVCISVDLVGVQRCGYCGEVVDYESYFKGWLKERQQELKDKGLYEALFRGEPFKAEGNPNTWKIVKILKKKGIIEANEGELK